MAKSTILRTFRVDPNDWDDFLAICNSQKISATSALTAYIKMVNRLGEIDIQTEADEAVDDIQKQLKDICDRLEALEAKQT